MSCTATPCRVDDPSTAANSTDTTLMRLLSGGLLGAQGPDFERLAERFRAEMAPRDALETLQFDLILTALFLLRKVVAGLASAPLGDLAIGRSLGQSHRMLSQSLKEYRKLRERDLDGEGDEAGPDDGGMDIFPMDDFVAHGPLEPAADWRERITFPAGVVNENDPATWPVVRGTTIEVEHLMSLLSDSWPVAKILKIYDQLTIDDLRACMGCDAEGLAGPPPA